MAETDTALATSPPTDQAGPTTPQPRTPATDTDSPAGTTTTTSGGGPGFGAIVALIALQAAALLALRREG